MRHTVSLAISAGLVKRMERTRPWYFRTSSDIVKEAKETGGSRTATESQFFNGADEGGLSEEAMGAVSDGYREASATCPTLGAPEATPTLPPRASGGTTRCGQGSTDPLCPPPGMGIANYGCDCPCPRHTEETHGKVKMRRLNSRAVGWEGTSSDTTCTRGRNHRSIHEDDSSLIQCELNAMGQKDSDMHDTADDGHPLSTSCTVLP